MNGLVLELQRDAMESTTKVTTLLRKALVVARKLRVAEFQQWINAELDGYASSIPEYRRVQGEIKAFNRYNGWIPVIIQDAEIQELLTGRLVGQPIGELESLVRERKKNALLQMALPAEVESKLMREATLSLRPVLIIGESQIHKILESVRNTVLNWSLQLEEDGVRGEGMTFTEAEVNQAKKATDIVIHNFQGIMGDVHNSHVSQTMSMNIEEGNLDSLKTFLASLGVEAEDISELSEAIQRGERPLDKHNYGPGIACWIGKMVSKAASGSWNIAAATAADLLARAIASYYGLG